jgi:hypothetical protein
MSLKELTTSSASSKNNINDRVLGCSLDLGPNLLFKRKIGDLAVDIISSFIDALYSAYFGLDAVCSWKIRDHVKPLRLFEREDRIYSWTAQSCWDITDSLVQYTKRLC